MFKKIRFIAVLPNINIGKNGYTLYFIEKTEKIILPIEFENKNEIRFFANIKENFEIIPNIYETFKKTAQVLGGQLLNIIIYAYKGGIYYTYLTISHNKKYIQINVKLLDALSITKVCNIPIYAKKDILYKQGIKVTAKILRDALLEES